MGFTAVIPALALATTRAELVEVPPDCGRGSTASCKQFALRVSGSPAADAITLAKAQPQGILIGDPAGATAGAGCAQVSPTLVRCDPTGAGSAVDAGAGSDRVDATMLGGFVKLGGGPDDDLLLGGPGNDEMDGGPGRDTLRGGAAPDVLDGGAPGESDLLDGGAGEDTASYRTRIRGVDVDLGRAGGQGERGENDTFIGIENVQGGKGADRLQGDGGANKLDGSVSFDQKPPLAAESVRGGGGDDVVLSQGAAYGDGGNDGVTGVRAFGGAGRDFVEGSALASCGAGRDYADVTRRIGPDCERVGLDSDEILLRLALPLRRAGSPFGRFTLDSPCTAGRRGKPCRVVLTARVRRGERFVRGRGVVARAERRYRSGFPSVALRLSPAGRRLLRRRRKLDVRVEVLFDDAYTVQLRERFVTRLVLVR